MTRQTISETIDPRKLSIEKIIENITKKTKTERSFFLTTAISPITGAAIPKTKSKTVPIP